jgi:hypothetical protein
VRGGHDKNEGTTMKLGGSAKQCRNASLRDGEFGPPSGTLFEAIYKELKYKEERREESCLFSKMFSRLQENRAKKKLVGPERNR